MNTFHYEKPDSPAAIVARLSEANGTTALLAGGTDLMAQLRSRVFTPDLVIDLKGAEELHALRADDEGLSIGAAVIFNRLLEEQEITGPYAALREATAQVASYQIRNRATLVGNVSNASPCADSVPPLCVLGAEVELLGPTGARRVPVQKFIVGNRETLRQPGEFVTRVIVPTPTPGTWSGFSKKKRVKGHDLALASAALLRDPGHKRLRLAVGSCSPTPALLVLDEMFDKPDMDEVARRTQETIHPIDDVRASIEYRRDMVAVMVRRLFSALQASC
jgi:CO/xanthine dehydrogenase FAD-binding subunit